MMTFRKLVWRTLLVCIALLLGVYVASQPSWQQQHLSPRSKVHPRYTDAMGIKHIESGQHVTSLREVIPPESAAGPGSCDVQRKFGSLPVTALASFPGSGNTWMRHLLEQSTGYFTGSIYGETVLHKAFPGEGVTDGRVIAIKTHKKDNRTKTSEFERAIVLSRNPLDALLADFNRFQAKMNHTGFAPEAAFETEWPRSFRGKLRAWLDFHLHWYSFPRPVHVIRYEQLKEDLRGTLRNTIEFLGLEVNETMLDCMEQNSDGQFKRKHLSTTEDRFTEKMKEDAIKVAEQAEGALRRRWIST